MIKLLKVISNGLSEFAEELIGNANKGNKYIGNELDVALAVQEKTKPIVIDTAVQEAMLELAKAQHKLKLKQQAFEEEKAKNDANSSVMFNTALDDI